MEAKVNTPDLWWQNLSWNNQQKAYRVTSISHLWEYSYALLQDINMFW